MLKSLSRGIEVLKCFTPETPRLPLTTIAEELGVPKGSAFRLVSTLQQLGFLDQDSASRHYRLGVKVLALGQTYLAGLAWPDVALPYLEELAEATGESTSMAILDGTEIVYAARASIRRVMSANLSVGSRLPTYCTSMGKVLLAHLEPSDLEDRLDDITFIRYTHRTITDTESLRTSLDKVRERGYCVSDRELDLSLCSVAAPIRDGSGAVVSAINISTFATRTPLGSLEEYLIPRLLEAAHTISSALGFRPGARNHSARVPT